MPKILQLFLFTWLLQMAARSGEVLLGTAIGHPVDSSPEVKPNEGWNPKILSMSQKRDM